MKFSLVFLVLGLLALWSWAVESKSSSYCNGTADAIAAVESDGNVTVHYMAGMGYGFVGVSSRSRLFVGKGIVVLPEDNVAPEAYAPLARELALLGIYVAVVEKPSAEQALQAMMQKLEVEQWTLAGHGNGGALAAQMARTLLPKVKALILLAAAVPKDLDLTTLNLLVVVMYGRKDTIVTRETVEQSFSHLSGDSEDKLFWNLGHYDFAKSECVGNGEKLPRQHHEERQKLDLDFTLIVLKVVKVVSLSTWMVASEKAVSFSDNEKLTPGHNDSKVYPGDIRVQCTTIPIPNTSPQRFWWVFTPTEIKGGLVYYSGAGVDARAYFPLAFEIAARGHLVVIVQIPLRIAILNFWEARAVILSKNPLLSVVPKGKWALAGHSAGGSATTLYAKLFGKTIYAIVMHAGGWAVNMTQMALPVAQIYGTLDNISPGGYDRYRYQFTEPPPKGNGPLVNLQTAAFIVIEKANHYQVGDYGYQKPDQISTLSIEQQVTQFAIETVSFLDDVASGKSHSQNTPRSETM